MSKHAPAPPLQNQKGQTFIEFILILLLLTTISFGFLKGFRTMVGGRWESMIRIISVPDGNFTIP